MALDSSDSNKFKISKSSAPDTGVQLEIDIDGNMTVNTGNVVIGTAGKGIDFSATADAGINSSSMTSELLDDYEEGTWTPTIMDDSLNGTGESQVYHYQMGRYTKIGNRVFIQCKIKVDEIGTLTSGQTGRIGGLPFNSNATSRVVHGLAMGNTGGLNVTAGHAQSAVINENLSYITLHNFDATAGSSGLLISEIGDDASFTVSGHYEI